jgi:hypothetical protein
MLMGNTFTCANCGGTFEKGRTDEEAMTESKSLFGDISDNEIEVVCDDCFEKMRNRERAELLKTPLADLIRRLLPHIKVKC